MELNPSDNEEWRHVHFATALSRLIEAYADRDARLALSLLGAVTVDVLRSIPDHDERQESATQFIATLADHLGMRVEHREEGQ